MLISCGFPGDLERYGIVITPDLEYAPALTADELEIFFTRVVSGSDPQIFHATRGDRSAAFGAPEKVDSASGFVEAATVTPDGRAICYHALVGGQFVLRRIAR